jgi:UDP-N-acetylglucosamine acyltransferase
LGFILKTAFLAFTFFALIDFLPSFPFYKGSYLSSSIHPSAVIHPSASLAPNVEVGPFCTIGPNCTLAEGVVLGPHVNLVKNVRLQAKVSLSCGATLGGDPQDTKYRGETSWVEVGEGSKIGEFATIHRATGEGELTRFGAHGLLMAYAHLGHNVQVGDHCVLANGVQLGGHVQLEGQVTVGGNTAVHQHVRVGRLAMVGGMSGLRKDVPPFAIVDGVPSQIFGTNVLGLRRNQMTAAERAALKRAFKALFAGGQPLSVSMLALEAEAQELSVLQELLSFIRTSKRGLCPGRPLRQGRPHSVQGNESATFAKALEMASGTDSDAVLT